MPRQCRLSALGILLATLASSSTALGQQGGAAGLPAAPATRDDAQAWAATFPPARLVPYVQPVSSAVMVVAAGEDREGLRLAAAMLAAALRASGAPGVVMDDAALGPLPRTESDGMIARAAATHAVWQTFLLRAGPAPTVEDSDAPAYLRVLDGTGRELLLAEVRPGLPFATVVPDPVVVAQRQARRQIEERLLHFTERPEVPATASIARLRPRLGPTGRPLGVADYYDLVGRPDLARVARRQRRIQVGVALSGALVAIGGMIGVAATSSRYDDTATAAGMGTALAGGAIALLGLLTPAGPDIGLEAAHALGRRYNRRTLEAAHLADVPLDPDDLPFRPAPVSIVPSVGPRGGSLSLSLEF